MYVLIMVNNPIKTNASNNLLYTINLLGFSFHTFIMQSSSRSPSSLDDSIAI